MWDEKKFFEDFAAEADKVKPDPEFVEKMATLAREEQTSKITSFQNVKKWALVAAAACIVLVVGVGKFVQMGQPKPEYEMEQAGLLAGKESEELENSFVQAEMNGDVLKTVEAKLNGDALIYDEKGVEISQEKRNELLSYVENAILTEQTPEKEVSESYTIEEIQIDITKDNFMIIKIGENEVYYKVQ